ncbi:MAG: acetolactate decarboxylase [Bryobacteraceae bacterium]
MKNSKQTAAQLLIRSLVRQDVKHIFGIPGGKIMRQARQFPPLTEAAKHQAEKVFTNVQGTLAGFRTPTYAQGVGVAGFHLHFLRQDKQAGGHALDYRLHAGKVRICTVHELRVELPASAEFLKTNFEDQALNEKIKASEG